LQTLTTHATGCGLCVCSVVRQGGKNNIKEGGPHGSRAPSGRLRRQLEKDISYSPCELRRCLWCLLGSRSGASPEPEPLGFGGYVTSVPALPCLAAPGG
jgi:hypothetical protein